MCNGKIDVIQHLTANDISKYSSIKDYLTDMYVVFKKDFLETPIYFNNKILKLAEYKDYCEYGHGLFCHLFLCDKKNPDGLNVIEQDRCERIHWVRPIIENYNSNHIHYWWKTHRRRVGKKTKKFQRIFLWVYEKDYYVVIQKEQQNYRLITGYTIFKGKRKSRFDEYKIAVSEGRNVIP